MTKSDANPNQTSHITIGTFALINLFTIIVEVEISYKIEKVGRVESMVIDKYNWTFVSLTHISMASLRSEKHKMK